MVGSFGESRIFPVQSRPILLQDPGHHGRPGSSVLRCTWSCFSSSFHNSVDLNLQERAYQCPPRFCRAHAHNAQSISLSFIRQAILTDRSVDEQEVACFLRMFKKNFHLFFRAFLQMAFARWQRTLVFLWNGCAAAHRRHPCVAVLDSRRAPRPQPLPKPHRKPAGFCVPSAPSIQGENLKPGLDLPTNGFRICFRTCYPPPFLVAGRLERFIPDNPTSRPRKYRPLTSSSASCPRWGQVGARAVTPCRCSITGPHASHKVPLVLTVIGSIGIRRRSTWRCLSSKD